MMESMFRDFDEAMGLPPPVVRALWGSAHGACAESPSCSTPLSSAARAAVVRSPARAHAPKVKPRGARAVRADEWDEPSRLPVAGKETATPALESASLAWRKVEGGPCAFYEATVGVWPADGVRFRLLDQPEYPRRGSWCLTIESCQGAFSGVWSLFDRTEQPMRFFHSLDCAKVEANLIAQALFAYRVQKIPGPATSPRPAQRGTGAWYSLV